MKLVTTAVLLSILISGTAAQDFENDPEVKEIQARVVNVMWDISPDSGIYGEGSEQHTYISFTVGVELWNPYDTDLTSYGSSSCRWTIDLGTTLEGDPQLLTVCTADWGPRTYPSGLSNETIYGELELQNQSFSELPNATYLFSAGPTGYSNSSDNYYGLNMTASGGVILYSYETYPRSWGMILYHKSDAFSLDSQLGLITVLALVLGVVSRSKKMINQL